MTARIAATDEYAVSTVTSTSHVGQRHGLVVELKVPDCPRHAALKGGPGNSAPGSDPVVFRGSGSSVTNCTDGRSNCRFNHGHSLTLIHTCDLPGPRAGLFVGVDEPQRAPGKGDGARRCARPRARSSFAPSGLSSVVVRK
jgi:hypothetical protein